jgi:hypothetical protein
MVSSNSMYLILNNNTGSRRTRGIRIKMRGNICMGVVFFTKGGYKYQECLHNRTIKDEITSLRKEKVS